MIRARPIRIEGDVAYVPLTKGYTAIIDAADAHLVEGFNWRAETKPRNVYAARTGRANEKCGAILLHRVIAKAPDHMQVDHINCDGLDNRRSNLRLATHAENGRNVRKPATNTSGVKGVSWDKERGKWSAEIMRAGKKRRLGRFASLESAAAAYAAASAELHGEFGRIA